MIENYNCIDNNSTFELIEKKSRFIANVFKIQNKEEAEEIINKIKKEHINARHNVFAYRTIENDLIIDRFSDDGEPSGTAGAPILNMLVQSELVNVLVVVTRYFGGILLGTGGLFKAYSDSAKRAIEDTKIVKLVSAKEVKIETQYNYLGKIQYFCQSNNCKIENIEYLENINIFVLIPNFKYNRFIEFIDEATCKASKVRVLGSTYMEET